MKKNIGFVICSRLDSSRIPGKVFNEINGVRLIEHTIKRLKKTGITICIAVPPDQKYHYDYLREKYGVIILSGYAQDPLRRMWYCADRLGLDSVIRVTHDKCFIDESTLFHAIDQFRKKDLDYAYSTEFTDGSAFEIISARCLLEAANKYKNVEHISYAVKSVAEQKEHFNVRREVRSSYRLLVDYPEDLIMLENVMQACGNDCTLEQAIHWLDSNQWAMGLNNMPRATVYTCAFNAELWLEETMKSVVKQSFFPRCEYIIIDDHSTDRTYQIASRFVAEFNNIKLIRNSKNIGLASSSNVALENAKGEYIVRLDADDYWPKTTALATMIDAIIERDLDILYPANYHGDFETIQAAHEQHHAGGSLMRTKALNHVKFTDRLRNYEGLDLFMRAKDQCKIGYLAQPVFFYRQHSSSMSKTNLQERERTKAKIEQLHGP